VSLYLTEVRILQSIQTLILVLLSTNVIEVAKQLRGSVYQIIFLELLLLLKTHLRQELSPLFLVHSAVLYIEAFSLRQLHFSLLCRIPLDQLSARIPKQVVQLVSYLPALEELEQLPGNSCILAADHVHLEQSTVYPNADILHVSNGCWYDY